MSHGTDANQGRIAVKARPWTELFLVCRKCGKKRKGGFGEAGRETLSEALRSLLAQRGLRRQVRVVKVGCLGVCPRNGVTVIRGARPGEMLLVERGADLEPLLAALQTGRAPDA